MFAVIYQLPARPGASMVRVAGRPLVERQLQWLRAAGCQRVALEAGTDVASGDLARWLAENEALAADVALVLSSRPLGAREVASRAGFPVGAPFLALPADVLGDGDLTVLFRAATVGGAWALCEPPERLSRPLEAGMVRLLSPRAEHPRIIDGLGWAVRIGGVREAMTLGSAALLKRLPEEGGEHVWSVQIHASEMAPGIWIARGARVDPGAKLVAPVLVGPDAVVCSGARVGPDAFIGDRAVIEPGATVIDCTVEPGTIVGEGVELRSCVASPDVVTELDGEVRAMLEDSLLIGRRDRPSGAPLSSRFAALVMLVVLALPAAVLFLARALLGRPSWRVEQAEKAGARRVHEGVTGVAMVDLVPRLADVLRGARMLVGVAPKVEVGEGASPGLLVDAMAAPWGAIDIGPALVPDGGDLETRLRGRAWYASSKSARVDAELLGRLIAGWLGLTGAGASGPASEPTIRKS